VVSPSIAMINVRASPVPDLAYLTGREREVVGLVTPGG
jgi:hypothetical protein